MMFCHMVKACSILRVPGRDSVRKEVLTTHLFFSLFLQESFIHLDKKIIYRAKAEEGLKPLCPRTWLKFQDSPQ